MNQLLADYKVAHKEAQIARSKEEDCVSLLMRRCDSILRMTRNTVLDYEVFQIQRDGIYCHERPHIPGTSCPTIPYEQLDMSDDDLIEIGKKYQLEFRKKEIERKQSMIKDLQDSISAIESSTQE